MSKQNPASLTDHGKLRLHGSLAVQRGRAMFLTAMTAKQMSNHTKVDTYNSTTSKGYQRELNAARARQAANYYDNGGRMPNPVLLNVRKEDFSRVRVVIHEGEEDYREAVDGEGDWIGPATLVVPPELAVWLYDGQHRAAAFNYLLQQGDGFSSYPIPATITLGLSDTDEMKEFYEVNTNAKSVKTDLAWEILKQQAALDPELAMELELHGKDWIVRGQHVVEELRKLGGPWSDCIQLPNQSKRKHDRLIIKQAQFVRSIKPVLDMPLMTKADPQMVAQVIDAYWRGIAEVLPEPFAEDGSPKQWVIQKGTGAVVFHSLMPEVIEVLRARAERLGDSGAYARALRGLRSLSGEITTEEEGRIVVAGVDFWLSGPRGVASQFNGASGRKRLEIIVRAALPKAAEELTL